MIANWKPFRFLLTLAVVNLIKRCDIKGVLSAWNSIDNFIIARAIIIGFERCTSILSTSKAATAVPCCYKLSLCVIIVCIGKLTIKIVSYCCDNYMHDQRNLMKFFLIISRFSITHCTYFCSLWDQTSSRGKKFPVNLRLLSEVAFFQFVNLVTVDATAE